MNIVVLAGGISTERDVSIVSGIGVCKALRAKSHRAILVDVYFGKENVNLSEAFPEVYDVDAEAEYIRSFNDQVDALRGKKDFFGANVIELCKSADMVFLALHGEDGENGKVQATFDLFHIKYTGTDYLSSAICMDKGLTKVILNAAQVPTPRGITLKKNKHKKELSAYTMKFPVVVKPCCGGSSIGVSIVDNQKDYEKALEAAFSYEDEIVVEDYIHGREFSVGVINGKALPVIEIAPLEGFYNYENKYKAGSTIETCPANLPEDITRKMQEYAQKGFKALGMDSYGRLDFLMNENEDLYCLEANSLPGMTPTSLLPQEAAALGMDFPTLCEELIRVSLDKYKK
ncbi:MAG: D-alanine--D-alanine ligase [Lachnospiraceae bacterium]|nr:D-alanine--D-alanine ligase [Lachnospiraceae bacterium]